MNHIVNEIVGQDKSFWMVVDDGYEKFVNMDVNDTAYIYTPKIYYSLEMAKSATIWHYWLGGLHRKNLNSLIYLLFSRIKLFEEVSEKIQLIIALNKMIDNIEKIFNWKNEDKKKCLELYQKVMKLKKIMDLKNEKFDVGDPLHNFEKRVFRVTRID